MMHLISAFGVALRGLSVFGLHSRVTSVSSISLCHDLNSLHAALHSLQSETLESTGGQVNMLVNLLLQVTTSNLC